MSEQDRRRIVALQEDNIKLIDDAERSRAEAARYRAALEEILEKVALVPEKYIPSPDIINFYEVQVIDAIERIADRALRSEEDAND